MALSKKPKRREHASYDMHMYLKTRSVKQQHLLLEFEFLASQRYSTITATQLTNLSALRESVTILSSLSANFVAAKLCPRHCEFCKSNESEKWASSTMICKREYTTFKQLCSMRNILLLLQPNNVTLQEISYQSSSSESLS